MDNAIVIRAAAPEDAAVLFDFVCELEEQTFDYIVFQEIFLTNVQKADHIYLVALAGDVLVGYISCHGQLLLHHGGKVFEIQELFVRSDYRGKRIGQALVEGLEERLNKEKYKSLEVTTNRGRKDTVRFYERCGFNSTHVKLTKEPQHK